MKKMSTKARSRYMEAKSIRDELKNSVGQCERCNSRPFYGVLDVHEISRGVHRQKSLDKPYALLILCRLCHDQFGSAAEWPEARQLALLAEKRLWDWDLKAYLELTNPRAPRRIEIEEVVAHMKPELLKVEEVASRMRVNRRTAQNWIDSGELQAIDVRRKGAQRAMWRVQPIDLLEFAQKRKSSKAEQAAK